MPEIWYEIERVIDTFLRSEVETRFTNASVVETKLRINQNILKFVAQLVFPLKMAQQMSSLRRRDEREGTSAHHNHRNISRIQGKNSY